MFKHNQRQRGFTLVELLVVIAIIGVLSSVILVAMTSARAKSRDARRLSDVKALQGAIELYRDGNKGKAPDALDCLVGTGTGCTGNSFLGRIPDDPINESPYLYSYARGGATGVESFKYYIQFETETDTTHGAAGAYCATSKQIVARSGASCTTE